MALNILVTGRGKSGSWQIRGEQLGAAIGAHVEANINSVKGFDLAVVVKRPRDDLLERLRQRSIPVVWDIVDAWPQPHGNEWTREECLLWLDAQVDKIKPFALVAATKAMAVDCERYDLPVLFVPHHARPGQRINPIRARVKRVGYEGGEQYLNGWRGKIERACAERGLQFEINPASLADVDVVLALRDQTGYAPRNWKSGVKLANAQGSGTPCIVGREAGYVELSTSVECWADDEAELAVALDELAPQYIRQAAQIAMLDGAPSLEGVARAYQSWLSKLAPSSS